MIVSVAASTCFKSTKIVELASIDVPVSRSTSSSRIVAVTADVVVLVIPMLVTIVVVADGTVYSVVLDVAADVRASTLDVVAISYYIPFCYSPSASFKSFMFKPTLANLSATLGSGSGCPM